MCIRDRYGYTSTVGNGVVAPDPDIDPTDSDDNGNANPNGTTSSAVVELVAGEEVLDESDLSSNPDHAINTDDANTNLTVDFGFEPRPGISLGNRIWNDLNGDGVHDADEPGIDGVVVELIDAAGTVLAFDTTANDCLLYTSPSPRDATLSRMPSSA